MITLLGRSVLLNLIPYNPTSVNHEYKAPTEGAKGRFVKIIREEYQVRCTLRQTLGQDIDSACGQLVIDKLELSKASGGCTEDLEDMFEAKSRNTASKSVTRNTRVKTTAFSMRALVIAIVAFITGYLILWNV